MKKLSAFSLMLCLILLIQTLALPAFATETESTDPFAAMETAPVVEFGMAEVLNGCRTIEAQVPLGGSDRMLESAVSAFVYERNTGTVVYAYNPDMIMQPGTLTKLVTAIVAIENGNLDDEVTVSSRNYKYLPAGAKNAKLREGEVMTLRDLLYCMILEWANDAAVTIAEHIAGTQEEFVKMMNAWAQDAGCKDTRFADCHGLGSEGQQTTARDLARIIEEACKESEFREVFGANNYTVPATNETENPRNLKSLNYLKEETIVPKYNFKGVTGGIAHYSAASGASLVCTAEKKGMSYTVVVMGCERKFNKDKSWVVEYYGNYEEAWNLLQFSFEKYKICRLLHDGYALKQFTVAGGENEVVAQSHTNMDAILPAEAHQRQLIFKYSVQGGGLTAPIAYDQKVGTLQIYYRTSCVAETELFAMSSVRALDELDLDIQGAASRDDSNLSGFLTFLGIACLIILLPLVAYVMINNVRRIIARGRRRRRRKSRRRSRGL